jgi:hypothetical protein
MAKNLIISGLLLLVFAANGIVQGQKLKGIGISGGYVIPIQNVENGFSADLRLDFGEVLKYVFLFPSLGYWQSQEKNDNQNLTRKYINFGANFIGYINSKPRGFYGGVGIHYHAISAEEEVYKFNSPIPEIETSTDTKLGLSVLTGYLVPFKKFSVFVEPAYTFIHGDYDILQARLGIYYIF